MEPGITIKMKPRSAATNIGPIEFYFIADASKIPMQVSETAIASIMIIANTIVIDLNGSIPKLCQTIAAIIAEITVGIKTKTKAPSQNSNSPIPRRLRTQ